MSAAPNSFFPRSVCAATGWAFGAVYAGVLLSLVLAPPASRKLPAFGFSDAVPLVANGETTGYLAGAKADIVGPGGWHLPATYRYRYLRAGGQTAAGDVRVLATDMATPRTDARQLPELYAASPWVSPDALDPSWTTRATEQRDAEGRSWLEVNDGQGVYLVTRIDRMGRCTSTAEQVRRDRERGGAWRAWLGWPFSSRPEADPRALWVSMSVSKQTDGLPRSAEEIRGLWREVLTAMSTQALLAF